MFPLFLRVQNNAGRKYSKFFLIDEEVPSLDSSILALLGDEQPAPEPSGPSIHQDIATRWSFILNKGLGEEAVTKLMKKYPPPDNCLLLKAPSVNLEVAAAVRELETRRDQKLAGQQSQIGSALASLGQLTTGLISEGGSANHPLIELASDASRLLLDLHYKYSSIRRELLILGLRKDLKDTLVSASADGWLFGKDLDERIKASKDIEKSGLDLRAKPSKTVNKPPNPNNRGLFKDAFPAEPGKRLPSTSSCTQDIQSGWTKQPSRAHPPTSLPDPKDSGPGPSSSTRGPPLQEIEGGEVCSMVGRLRNFLPKWKEITQDKRILSWILGLKIPFVIKPTQSLQPSERHWSDSEKITLRASVQELLAMGAISKVSHCKGDFISSIFLRPKPDGSRRLILNLKSLNKFIRVEHFKLEDQRTVCNIIQKHFFMSTLDLKNAYYLIAIDKSYRKFLRFRFDGVLYEYNCMPFGINCAPFVFTKLMKPLLAFLRGKGLPSVVYLDDFLLLGRTMEDCKRNVTITAKLLQELGFVINYEKSILTPSQTCRYLGLIYNSNAMSVSIPEDKRPHLLKCIKFLLRTKSCRIRVFAKIIGKLIAVCPAVRYGWGYTKLLEREKFLALRRSRGNYDRLMTVPSSLHNDLNWWLSHITSSNPIRLEVFHLEIFSDASLTGWGIHSNDVKSHGFWSLEEKTHHINYLELKAAFFGLRCCASNRHSENILLRIDNTTAVAYINRMGGVQHPKLNSLCRKIWQWCEERNLFIFASYINTKENFVADTESRSSHFETEWELNDKYFKQIILNFGPPNIDLFASRINSKCDLFISWHPDPDAFKVDAFTVNWKKFKFYAFPPFSMILKTLQKIIGDKAEGIVVVPYWPTQPWYPIFTSLLKLPPLYLQAKKDLLLSFNKSQPHPLWPQLILVAGLLSSRA
nr:unnamed protein product [Callosobruchus chinensis]